MMGRGAVLHQHGAYAYRLGGRNLDGSLSKEVWSCPLDSLEIPGSWTRTADLPMALSFMGVYSAGSILYLAGGEDETGPRREVYYTLIQNGGQLGFPTGTPWITSPHPLPVPLSRGASVMNDGRIFLIGGLTGQGDEQRVLDTIFQARIAMDLQLGQWYQSPARLPSPRQLTGAVVQKGRIYLAAGDDLTSALTDTFSFRLGEHGLLDDLQLSPPLPLGLSIPLLQSSGDDLLILGGRNLQGDSTGVFRLVPGSTAWVAEVDNAQEPIQVPALGASSLISAGKLFYLNSSVHESPDTLGTYGLGNFNPLHPGIFPGSGLVNNRQVIFTWNEPGTVVRYRVILSGESLPPALNSNDFVLSTFKIESPFRMVFQGFSASGVPSALVFRDYTPQTLGLIAYINETLVVEASPELRSLEMKNKFSETEWTHQTTVWYKILITSLQAYKTLHLIWQDRESLLAGGYTARVQLSLFEADRLSWVLTTAGNPVNRLDGSIESPVSVSLGEGEYYLKLESLDILPPPEAAPLNLGFSLRRVD